MVFDVARTKSVFTENNICIVGDCVNPVKAKGLCSTHHQRQFRTGSTELRSQIKQKVSLQRECRAAGCEVLSVRLGLCQEHLIEFQLEHISK